MHGVAAALAATSCGRSSAASGGTTSGGTSSEKGKRERCLGGGFLWARKGRTRLGGGRISRRLGGIRIDSRPCGHARVGGRGAAEGGDVGTGAEWARGGAERAGDVGRWGRRRLEVGEGLTGGRPRREREEGGGMDLGRAQGRMGRRPKGGKKVVVG
uniref:Uncharacterized protein n=1 Tax=Oryza meridionalis TaxID=40149 RepID=A0A0E0C3B7_9ORYZ